MSQSFRFKSDEFDENAEDSSGVEKNGASKYATDSQVRNIGFTLLSGERKFLNYAYLVSGTLSPNYGSLTLHFTSENVVLQGVRLNILYEDLFFHRPMEIKAEKSRYDVLEDENKPVINDISIEEK